MWRFNTPLHNLSVCRHNFFPLPPHLLRSPIYTSCCIHKSRIDNRHKHAGGLTDWLLVCAIQRTCTVKIYCKLFTNLLPNTQTNKRIRHAFCWQQCHTMCFALRRSFSFSVSFHYSVSFIRTLAIALCGCVKCLCVCVCECV